MPWWPAIPTGRWTTPQSQWSRSLPPAAAWGASWFARFLCFDVNGLVPDEKGLVRCLAVQNLLNGFSTFKHNKPKVLWVQPHFTDGAIQIKCLSHFLLRYFSRETTDEDLLGIRDTLTDRWLPRSLLLCKARWN